MPSLVVVGAQWGDEGKGKLVDYLTSNADCVARFQGGNNAGHTLVVDGVTTKLSLVPSGILHPGRRCCLGAGVVIDPRVFVKEVDQLIAAGVEVSPERLVVDRDAHLILDYHRILDSVREESLGGKKIGTTGRGIGPCYEDRARRAGVRCAELNDLETLKERLTVAVEQKNRYLEAVHNSSVTISFDDVWETVLIAKEKVLPYMGNVSLYLDAALNANKKVVFEGAQGTLLDQIHGTIPYVTSSNTIAGAATTGCGIGPGHLDYILGVAKAYTTRVGEGPYPTELKDDIGSYLGKKGHEFGTVTGRSRRCGWFDALAMRRAVRLNGINSLAITKLDVLSGLDTLKICIGYSLDGIEVDDVPALSQELDRVSPRYIELKGWKEDITGVTKWHHLPAEARFYLSTISEIIGCPITIVSVGPERNQTIFSRHATFVKNFYEQTSEENLA